MMGKRWAKCWSRVADAPFWSRGPSAWLPQQTDSAAGGGDPRLSLQSRNIEDKPKAPPKLRSPQRLRQTRRRVKRIR